MPLKLVDNYIKSGTEHLRGFKGLRCNILKIVGIGKIDFSWNRYISDLSINAEQRERN